MARAKASEGVSIPLIRWGAYQGNPTPANEVPVEYLIGYLQYTSREPRPVNAKRATAIREYLVSIGVDPDEAVSRSTGHDEPTGAACSDYVFLGGRFKGKTFDDAPFSYLAWYVCNNVEKPTRELLTYLLQRCLQYIDAASVGQAA